MMRPSRRVLVRYQGSRALAAAICVLLDDPARRVELARRARAFVEQTYTWERIALQVDEIYARAAETARM